VVEEGLLEEPLSVVPGQTGQVFEVVSLKPKPFDEVDDRGEAAGHRVAAAERCLSKEQVEDRFVVRSTRLPVAVGHRELIEVGEQRLLSHGCHGVICTLTYLA